MQSLTKKDKDYISNAVREAESKTSGEIVPVILSKSDFYPAAHFRLAIVVSVLTSILVYYFVDFDDPFILLWSQAPAMVAGYLLGFVPFLKRLFSTHSEMNEEVHQKALEIFHHHGISKTQDRTGVLILVSLLEHRVEVLGDIGINEITEGDFWGSLVSNLIEQIKNKNLVEGIVQSIATCGKLLNTHFPIKDSDENELSNALITDV